MTFPDAVKYSFSNYVKFSGRATRSEYWYWVLFVTIVAMLLSVVDLYVLHAGANKPLTSVFYAAILLPSLAVACRRLHDIDRSGWWQLLGLIPIIGTLILIIWYCTKGSFGPNRFGI